MNRRGVTLLELLIGLVLLAMLGVVVTTTLTTASRVAIRAVTRLATARTISVTGALLREELGHRGRDEVTVAGATSVDFSRVVGDAPVCDVQGHLVALRQSEWWGIRDPEPDRDDALLLSDVATGSWVANTIVAVGNGHCPDGSAAIQLTVGSTVAAAAVARIVEPVRLRGYLSNGNGWWGLAPASGLSPVQPFAGPLATPIGGTSFIGTALLLRFRPAAGGDTVLAFPLGPP